MCVQGVDISFFLNVDFYFFKVQILKLLVTKKKKKKERKKEIKKKALNAVEIILVQSPSGYTNVFVSQNVGS